MKKAKNWHRTSWNVALVLAGLILGFFFAAQWNVTPPSPSPGENARENLGDTLQALEEEQEALKKIIRQLRDELSKREQESAQSVELLRDLTADLELQRAAAGLYAMRGPGLRVTLADSAMVNPGPNANPNDLIIHDYDLRDIVNTLWSADAEAIAINDERVVGTTSIVCVGSTVMVNDTRLSPPYEIRAIGNPDAMRRVLTDPDALQDLRQRAKTLGVQFKVTDRNDVQIPGFRGSYRVEYARAGR